MTEALSQPRLLSICDSVAPARRVRDVAFLLLCLIASIALFFRFQIVNHFQVLISDRFDGIIETAILEHWYNFWRGFTPFNQTFFFYPVRDTLGYNDGYFLYGCIYTVFRICGLNPFLSSECVDIVLVALGFLFFYLCARIVFAMPGSWAALASMLFAVSSNVYHQAVHAQILAIALAPLLATLLYMAGFSLVQNRRRRAAILAGSAVCLHAAWLLSTFYMAWFFVFFSIFLVLAAVTLNGQQLWSARVIVSRNRLLLASLLVLYGAVNIPFALVYVPKLLETGQHGYAESLTFVPSILDVFNIGRDNLVAGNLYGALSGFVRPDFPDFSEKTTGFPPLLLALFALSCGSVLRRGARRDIHGDVCRVVALGACLSWICVLKVGNVTLWSLIFHIVPGAKTVRVVARYQIFLSFPVTMLAVDYIRRRGGTLVRPGVAVLGLILVMEQLTLRGNVGLASAAELERLKSVPPVPAGCHSFFASQSRSGAINLGDQDGYYSHNVDAMMIAEYIHLPTLNGMDTFVPTDWNLVKPVEADRYLADVQMFVAVHDLSDVCSLNLQTMRWDPAPLPEVQADRSADPRPTRCEGSFDLVTTRLAGSHPIVTVAGWADESLAMPHAPTRIAMRMEDGLSSPRYFPAFTTPRSDVVEAFANPGLLNSGFRSTMLTSKSSTVVVTPVLYYGDQVLLCVNLSKAIGAVAP